MSKPYAGKKTEVFARFNNTVCFFISLEFTWQFINSLWLNNSSLKVASLSKQRIHFCWQIIRKLLGLALIIVNIVFSFLVGLWVVDKRPPVPTILVLRIEWNFIHKASREPYIISLVSLVVKENYEKLHKYFFQIFSWYILYMCCFLRFFRKIPRNYL